MIFLFFVSMFRPNMIPLVAWNYWHTFRTLWLPHQKTPSSTRLNANAVILLKARLSQCIDSFMVSCAFHYLSLWLAYECHLLGCANSSSDMYGMWAWLKRLSAVIEVINLENSTLMRDKESRWYNNPFMRWNRDFEWIPTSQKRSWWAVVPGLPT